MHRSERRNPTVEKNVLSSDEAAMNVRPLPQHPAIPSLRHTNRSDNLKRKLNSYLYTDWHDQLSYPSPPMSTSPSPPIVSSSQSSPTATATTSIFMPAAAVTAHTLGAPFYASAASSPNIGRQSVTTPVPSATPSSAKPPTNRTVGTREGRKSKAHVASACINCKRAHLSCDVNRPCARCVASGKQVRVVEYGMNDSPDLMTGYML
jgi:hypothetical protein